ncbi:MAG: protoporphyrinogen oxidase [Bdellovibrionales bacterium]|nr:protoporphyrinogen oxidase [Bdellovibrionales bacterium]
MKIAIIGGGISGLSVAHFLERQLFTQKGSSEAKIELDLFESDSRLGGKVQTTEVGDLLVERGADAILRRRGSDLDLLIKELGLEGEIVSPQRREFAIQHRGRLHFVPLGMLRPFPENLICIWKADLFSFWGKCVATVRPLLEKIFGEQRVGKDPSIASTLRNRYGTEVSRLFYETVFGGIHSGDSNRLSFQALYPHLVKSHEPDVSSIKADTSFISFRRGSRQLVESLRASLKFTKIRCDTTVEQVIQSSEGSSARAYMVTTSGGESLGYDVVISAVPAFAAAPLCENDFPQLRVLLERIVHSTSAIVTMAIRKELLEREPHGSGYLLAPDEQGILTGCTYSSLKWKGRAPDDVILLRIFFGRNEGPRHRADEELFELAKNELRAKLGFRGDPLLCECTRWVQGLPQYHCGHLELMNEIDRVLSDHPGLFLTGTSYRGVGIPDCVKQAKATASRVAAYVEEEQRGSAGKNLKHQSVDDDREGVYGESVCA